MRGAMFMAISMAGFTVNDALTKTVLGSLNSGQVMLVRGLFATVLVGLYAWRSGALKNLRQVVHPMVALRCMGELGGTLCFLAALANMPLANVSAVLQALPLAVTMCAALFLGEVVGWRRWVAIIAGFTGVMIIVRPGFDGFNAYSLLALLCVSFCAVRDLSTRSIPKEIPTLLVSTATAAIVAIAGAVLVIPMGGWTPMQNSEIGALALAASLLVVGYQFIIMSMREGDISYVAPFRYTALLWAILLGYLMFGDVPDMAMIVGALVVVSSGLYTLYRERKVSVNMPATTSTGPGMAPDGI
jgi:drug/metabolite transporter (DMT)-like permease